MHRFLSAAAFCVREQARKSPWLFALYLLLYAATATGPAALVELTRRLPRDGLTVAHAVGLALLIAVITSLGGVAAQMGVILSSAAELGHKRNLLNTINAIRKNELSTAERSFQARAAGEAIESHVAPGATLVASGIAALLSVILLCSAVGRISLAAGLFMFVGLAAVCGIDSLNGSISDRYWPRQMESIRKARYNEDLLIYRRSAMDLAHLGARKDVINRALKYRRDEYGLVVAARKRGILCDLADMLALTLALTGVVLSLRHTASSDLSIITVGLLGVVAATSSLGQLSWAFGAMANSVKPIESLREFLQLAAGKSVSTTEVSSPKITSLCLHNVGVRYPGQDQDALTDFSLTARAGDVIGIAGANGAGKSTLINALSGMVSYSGKICCQTSEHSSAWSDVRDPLLTVMSQDFGRYEYTIRESLQLGIEKQRSDADIWAALDIAEARSLVESLANGLDAQLGEEWEGIGLSGGQWQRLAIARSILHGRQIWLLDEPTSSIDAEAEDAIMAKVVDYCQARGILLFIVSHRATTLRRTDEIVVLEKGKVVQHGNYADLSMNPGTFHEMFRSQLEVADTISI